MAPRAPSIRVHGDISRLTSFSGSTWSAIDFTITNIGTARIVPQAPQTHVQSSTPRNTTTTCMCSALPNNGGVNNQPSSEVIDQRRSRYLDGLHQLAGFVVRPATVLLTMMGPSTGSVEDTGENSPDGCLADVEPGKYRPCCECNDDGGHQTNEQESLNLRIDVVDDGRDGLSILLFRTGDLDDARSELGRPRSREEDEEEDDGEMTCQRENGTDASLHPLRQSGSSRTTLLLST